MKYHTKNKLFAIHFQHQIFVRQICNEDRVNVDSDEYKDIILSISVYQIRFQLVPI